MPHDHNLDIHSSRPNQDHSSITDRNSDTSEDVMADQTVSPSPVDERAQTPASHKSRDLTPAPALEDAPTPTRPLVSNQTPLVKGINRFAEERQVIPKNNLPVVFTGLMLAVSLAALDQTIVSTALPTIITDLNGSAAAYTWVASSYLLAGSIMIPLYGRLSDLIGRKPLFFFAVGLFLLGSALCGAAQNAIWLCCCRGVQGLGGGGIIGLVQFVTSDLVPLEKRGAFQGLFGLVWGISSVLGPLIGGALTEYTALSWRWCFLINLPLGGAAAVIVFIFLNLNPMPKRKLSDLVREFDWIGYLLLLSAIVIFVFGFTEAETQGFDKATTIALIVVGSVMFPIAIGWGFFVEARMPKVRPILPPRMFKASTPALILVTVALHGFAFFTCTYQLPIYFQAVRSASALLSGIYMLPYALVGSVVSLLAGIVVVKIGRWRPVFHYAWVMSTLGYGLMILIDGDASWATIQCTAVVAALGYGALFQVPLLGLLASMPGNEMAAATSTLALTRTLSGAIGLAVSQAVFTARVRSLTADIDGYIAPYNPSQDIQGLKNIQPPELAARVIYQYGQALNLTFIILAPLTGLGLLCSLGVKGYTLQRQNIKAADAEKEKIAEEETVGEPISTVQSPEAQETDASPKEGNYGSSTPAQIEEGQAGTSGGTAAAVGK